VHQVGVQPRLYYDARSTNHEVKESVQLYSSTRPAWPVLG